MNRASVTYALIYEIKGHSNYQVTECRKVFNIKTGRQLKMCYNNRSVGYWIDSKWYNIKNIKLKKIKNFDLPF